MKIIIISFFSKPKSRTLTSFDLWTSSAQGLMLTSRKCLASREPHPSFSPCQGLTRKRLFYSFAPLVYPLQISYKYWKQKNCNQKRMEKGRKIINVTYSNCFSPQSCVYPKRHRLERRRRGANLHTESSHTACQNPTSFTLALTTPLKSINLHIPHHATIIHSPEEKNKHQNNSTDEKFIDKLLSVSGRPNHQS